MYASSALVGVAPIRNYPVHKYLIIVHIYQLEASKSSNLLTYSVYTLYLIII